MTIIQALKAALADGKAYFSSDGDEHDRSIEHELDYLIIYQSSVAVTLTDNYDYRDGSIVRVSPVDGVEDEVYLCLTAAELHAKWEAE